MIGKVVTGCVAILPYHTATQDRGSECRDFGFISRIVTALGESIPDARRGMGNGLLASTAGARYGVGPMVLQRMRLP